jgi:hypothetical protein
MCDKNSPMMQIAMLVGEILLRHELSRIYVSYAGSATLLMGRVWLTHRYWPVVQDETRPLVSLWRTQRHTSDVAGLVLCKQMTDSHFARIAVARLAPI